MMAGWMMTATCARNMLTESLRFSPIGSESCYSESSVECCRGASLGVTETMMKKLKLISHLLRCENSFRSGNSEAT